MTSEQTVASKRRGRENDGKKSQIKIGEDGKSSASQVGVPSIQLLDRFSKNDRATDICKLPIPNIKRLEINKVDYGWRNITMPASEISRAFII